MRFTRRNLARRGIDVRRIEFAQVKLAMVTTTGMMWWNLWVNGLGHTSTG
jgi:hypothetical protein